MMLRPLASSSKAFDITSITLTDEAGGQGGGQVWRRPILHYENLTGLGALNAGRS